MNVLRWIFTAFVFFTQYKTLSLYGERGPSLPFVSGDTFRSWADHVFDETTCVFHPEKVKAGDLVFVKTDWEYLERFFQDYHPRIRHHYILVTHNSDHSAPGPFRQYLDSEKLAAWYAQNIDQTCHQKLHPLPIGLANKCWPHGDPNTFLAYRKKMKKANKRPLLCYMNFSPSTYPRERKYVWDMFARYPWCSSSPPKGLAKYLEDLSSAKFVLSPRGNGLDCHRTWEALLMGAIPIVRSSPLDSLFQGMPVLIVENWDDVSEEYLKLKYDEICAKGFDLNKAFARFWRGELFKKKREIRGINENI